MGVLRKHVEGRWEITFTHIFDFEWGSRNMEGSFVEFEENVGRNMFETQMLHAVTDDVEMGTVISAVDSNIKHNGTVCRSLERRVEIPTNS